MTKLTKLDNGLSPARLVATVEQLKDSPVGKDVKLTSREEPDMTHVSRLNEAVTAQSSLIGPVVKVLPSSDPPQPLTRLIR